MKSRSSNIAFILMVFLMFWFIIPGEGLIAQEQDDERYMPVYGENHPSLNKKEGINQGDGNKTKQILSSEFLINHEINGEKQTLPGNLKIHAELNRTGRMNSAIKKTNVVQLDIIGNQNTLSATQRGKENVLNLSVYGVFNNGNYTQKGKGNYIYDRIRGNGVTHKIGQYGEGLGILNMGMQRLPLIVNQKGKGMKLMITSHP